MRRTITTPATVTICCLAAIPQSAALTDDCFSTRNTTCCAEISLGISCPGAPLGYCLINGITDSTMVTLRSSASGHPQDEYPVDGTAKSCTLEKVTCDPIAPNPCVVDPAVVMFRYCAGAVLQPAVDADPCE